MILQIRRSAYLAAGILLFYGLLTLGYAIANPAFEAPDENHHFYTAQAIAENGKLPVAGENAARQEAAQPPLYYSLLAVVMLQIDESISLQINPYAQLGQIDGNPNLYVHEPGWQQGETAVRLLRSISLILGGISLIFIYKAGLLLWPEYPGRALLAMALVAFLPQYNFLHASISNDPLMICISTIVVWQVFQLCLDAVSHKRLFLLGLSLGAALLTKTAGLLLLLWVSGVFGWWLWRANKADRFTAVRDFILLTLLPAFLMSGWMFWRNWTLYGDITATNVFIELAGGARSLTLPQLLDQLVTVAQSAIAFFGWMTVRPPTVIYWIWGGIVLVALLGLSTAVRQHKTIRWPIVAILAAWVILLAAGWLQFMLRTPAEQGRLLFPALLPLALALAYGLSQFRYAWLAGFIALLTSGYTVLVVIPSAYAPPPIIAESELPGSVPLVQAQFGPLTLVGADILTETAVPGEPLALNLYWKKTAPVSEPPTEVIKLYGQDLALVGSRHTYHGNGIFPATFWPEDEIVVEKVTVTPANELAVPTEARIFVSILDHENNVEIGRVKITPAQWPQANTPALAQLGEGIYLTDAQVFTATNEIKIDLQWHITQAPQQALTTFIHLGDPTLPPLAQADGPPRQGFYPTTLWQEGEVFSDTYLLSLPEDLGNGRYPIYIGLYDPASGSRLPVFVDGERQPHDAYRLAEFTTSIR